MKLSVDRLLGDGVALELPNEGKESDRLELAHGVNVRGTYAHDQAAYHLQEIAGDELDWTRVLYFLGKGGSVRAEPLVLRGVELDALIARGELNGRARFAGHVSAREVQGKAVKVDLGQSPATPSNVWLIVMATLEGSALRYAHNTTDGLTANAMNLHATALDVQLSPKDVYQFANLIVDKAALRQASAGSLTLTCAAIEARAGRVTTGGVIVAFESLVASGIKLTSGKGGVDFEASSVEVRGLEVTVGDIVLTADRVQLPAGLAFAHGRLRIAEASAGELLFDLPRLRAGAEQPAPRASAKPSAGTGLLDWTFLDAVSGQVDVDLHVDANVPIIKRRRAIHKFRIAIDGGVINYRSLEHDMSALEDAVLDFELEKDRLILEKDIPLIPFDNETLVFWPLDAEGHALAEKHLIRLRTLVAAQLPSKPAVEQGGATKKPGFELTKLDLDPINALLRLPGPARVAFRDGSLIQIGAEGRPGISELRLRGTVRHRPGQPAEPGHLDFTLSNVNGGLHRIAIGERALSALALEIDKVEEATVAMEGLRPTQARAVLKGLHVRSLVLEPATTS